MLGSKVLVLFPHAKPEANLSLPDFPYSSLTTPILDTTPSIILKSIPTGANTLELEDEGEKNGSIIVVPLYIFLRRRLPNLFQMLTQESESMTYTKSNPSHSSLWLVLGDLNFLIALRKGVRNTQHPMSNFISFDRLSSQQKIFIT